MQFANATRITRAAGLAILLAAGTGAMAQMAEEPLVSGASATHIAVLSGDAEVPPVTTNGNGTAFFRFDPQTNSLEWTVQFADLTGPATAAHIHGPAAEGENADVIIDLAAGGTESPLQGTTVLSAEQANQLAEGEWYVNVHSEANPDGEIRGQIETNM